MRCASLQLASVAAALQGGFLSQAAAVVMPVRVTLGSRATGVGAPCSRAKWFEPRRRSDNSTGLPIASQKSLRF